MQAHANSARHGAQWLTLGWGLYRRRPFEYSWLVMSYMLAGFVVVALAQALGPAGAPLAFIYAIALPGLSVGFLDGARHIEEGRAITPLLIFRPFAPGQVNRAGLLTVGLVQTALFYVIWLGIRWMVFGTAAPELPKPDLLQPSEADVVLVQKQFLMIVLAGLGSSLPLWYAPVLASWHRLPPAKAIFFSAAAVWRNRGAFVVYLVCCASLMIAVLGTLIIVFDALGIANVLYAAFVPAAIILAGTIQCGHYVSYRSVFSIRSAQPPEPAG
jgi:hypothetical protein